MRLFWIALMLTLIAGMQCHREDEYKIVVVGDKVFACRPRASFLVINEVQCVSGIKP